MKRSKKCRAPKQQPLTLAARDIRTATTGELMNELKRRSVACLLASFNVEGLRPVTNSRVYGDEVTLRALSYALALELGEVLGDIAVNRKKSS